jgi:type VI secretion system protein ImpG
VAWPLLECALADPVGVLICAPPAEGAVGAAVQLLGVQGADAMGPVGFAADEAMLPPTATGFSGHRLVQEYFAFAPRFQFVRVTGLGQAVARAPGDVLELVLLFSRARSWKAWSPPSMFACIACRRSICFPSGSTVSW